MDVTRDGCGEDVAVYLLGALGPAEAERFEHHLAGCELCRADVARLRPVVDALPVTPEPMTPPPELKQRIMAEVEASTPERSAAAASSRPSWLRPLPALAAACVLLIAGIGVGVVATGGGPAQVVTGTVASTGGTAELEIDHGDARLRVTGMPRADGDRVYQVWLVRRGNETPEPTEALFNPTSDGRASVAVAGDMDGVERVMVSQEPRGGSQQPTTDPAIDIRM